MELFEPCGCIHAECDLSGSYELRVWKPTLREESDLCLGQMDFIGVVRGHPDYESKKGIPCIIIQCRLNNGVILMFCLILHTLNIEV